MTIAEHSFGAGGGEPYERALRSAGTGMLFLHSSRGTETAAMDFARWTRDADEVDLVLLSSVLGPVLDVGCGPGRMVRAALELGLEVLGLDVSSAAVELAANAGLPVVEGSVFDDVPHEGGWQTVLLVDGNIGIGGDVTALLTRCAELLSPSGEIVVELHSDEHRESRYTGRLVDLDGRSSATFPWAEIGLHPMVGLAEELGFDLRQAWSAGERSFCRLTNSAQ